MATLQWIELKIAQCSIGQSRILPYSRYDQKQLAEEPQIAALLAHQVLNPSAKAKGNFFALTKELNSLER
jgi:hypothetical protein